VRCSLQDNSETDHLILRVVSKNDMSTFDARLKFKLPVLARVTRGEQPARRGPDTNVSNSNFVENAMGRPPFPPVESIVIIFDINIVPHEEPIVNTFVEPIAPQS
jgi:hypothetical protein